MALHFSSGSEEAKKYALEVSRRWKHHYLSTEHYLFACCQLDAECNRWLARRGFNPASLEEEILRWVPEGDEVPIWEGIPEAPRIRRIMSKMAQDEAEAQKAMRIEPKHIVAALCAEGGGIAARILLSRGNDLKAIRLELLGGAAAPSAPERRGPSSSSSSSSAAAEDSGTRKGTGKEKFLTRYARDLVALAREGKVDPVIGRNDEVRRVLQILTRKTKSNPVLIGEPGVGKTAVVFGLALRIAQGQVPDILKDRRVLDLSLSSMIAGAKHRGEFEERLEGVISEAVADPSIILFIDEIHQLVGAGDRGSNDASNILKPALARGDFPVLGATTTDEYRKYIEADPALERRFQPVLVGEPSEADALEILKGLRDRYEAHHGVKFTDKALLQAVKLSVRFLPDRNLPDKAIDLIDESAARVKTRSGVFNAGERPVFEVSEEVVAEVVADWTGIPVQRMTEEESTRLLQMEDYLRQRVVGQDHAVEAVAQTIRVVRVGLVSPNRPGGVFLFLGPSGVGKTELAKALAEFLFGSEREIVRLDMSEFHDKHSLSRLIGSPPGYIGHDEEGQLTGAVRTKPYCVVLLDEVEKAHPEIFDIFLQVFDDGRLTDSKGRTVNFANTIIVLTSNLGAREVIASGQQVSQGATGQLDRLPELYQKALRGHFRPEFLNRIDEIVVFRSLQAKDLLGIVQIQLKRPVETLRQREIHLQVEQSAVDYLLEVGYQPQFGARPLQRAIHTYLERPLAEELLRNKAGAGSAITVYYDGTKLAFRVEPGAAPAPAAPPPTRPAPPAEEPWREERPGPTVSPWVSAPETETGRARRPEENPWGEPTVTGTAAREEAWRDDQTVPGRRSLPIDASERPEPPAGLPADLPLPRRPTSVPTPPPPAPPPDIPLPRRPTGATVSGERNFLPLSGDLGPVPSPSPAPTPRRSPPPAAEPDPWSDFRRPEDR